MVRLVKGARVVSWVILLLVGFCLVATDPAGVSPAVFQSPLLGLVDSDDNPDRLRTSTLVAQAELSLLPLAIGLTHLARFERFPPPGQSTIGRFLLRSLRTPRSPTAS